MKKIVFLLIVIGLVIVLVQEVKKTYAQAVSVSICNDTGEYDTQHRTWKVPACESLRQDICITFYNNQKSTNATPESFLLHSSTAKYYNCADFQTSFNSAAAQICTGPNIDNTDCWQHPEKYSTANSSSTNTGPLAGSSVNCGPLTNTPCPPPVGTSDCSVVGANNYALCCAGRTADIHADACAAYENTITGTIGGGSQSTASGSGGNTGSLASSSTSVKGTSNLNLSECYAIKFKSLLDILIWVECIINAGIIPLIFTITFLVFMWGIFRFIAATDNIKKEEGKNFIKWGLVGLFVMVGVWGILNIFGGIFGFSLGIPYLQTSSSYLQTSKANTK